MLILSRKIGETIMIGDGIAVTVSRISGNRVTLGIDAPDSVKIVREEIAHIEPTTPRPYGQPGTKAGDPCFRFGCGATIVAGACGDTYCPRCGWDSSRDEQ